MADLPDITRLRAALDVALTTLDSCSRPASPAPSSSKFRPGSSSPAATVASDPIHEPLRAPETPQRSSVLSNQPAHSTGGNAAKPPIAGPVSSLQPQLSSQKVLAEHTAAIAKVARQEERIKELEDHILRKSVEEANVLKTNLTLEDNLKESQARVQEYEEKLEQVLPLLQTLDQSRSEAKESKRRAQMTADELSALTSDHQALTDELAKCRKELDAVNEAHHGTAEEMVAMQDELKAAIEEAEVLQRQLQDEREESGWLQQVAQRQAKEMEDSVSSLRENIDEQEAECEALRSSVVTLQEENDALQARVKQQETAALTQQHKVAQVLSRMQAGNQGLAQEVAELQSQLLAMKQGKGAPQKSILVDLSQDM
eukprot:TRINITY_DN3925_c0_g1_i2.p1 TRINITY_DN3925_c0_g1~~TRINITY_DN3925_c0_g1_i2.p1  ORF type:complete len:371 (+),score=46.03 TRINITY_DN3925_c0_g1_i2:134-1246(+)